jgi:hypothetical protein
MPHKRLPCLQHKVAHQQLVWMSETTGLWLYIKYSKLGASDCTVQLPASNHMCKSGGLHQWRIDATSLRQVLDWDAGAT